MATSSRTSSLLGLVAWFAVSFAAATLGAIASVEAKSFYGQLTQPAWAPPAWVFVPMKLRPEASSALRTSEPARNVI